ncbi:hypothetical protein GT347_18405 [Xylophilus rhododendri]|uniref:Uncharacterized protein n=1 Tax=Xylophilus rhododendri TaxID=2697032 RepID=A0A857JAL7_9BURK|nr:hypothetical protein [Xylophilus rhododendri]QHI99778.1 hypothetical protein GT347_18405 [Xylophilus rhododendri]
MQSFVFKLAGAAASAPAALGLLLHAGPMAAEDGGIGRPPMLLSPQMLAMLGITTEEAVASNHAARIQRSTNETSLEDAYDLLERRMARVRLQSMDESMRPWLNEQGLNYGDVELQLRDQEKALRRMLRGEHARGRLALSQVPLVRSMFATAIADALKARPPAPTTPLATPAPTAVPATARVQPPDSARRTSALRLLSSFAASAHVQLSQIQDRSPQGLWEVVTGIIRFASAQQMLATFPCAVSVSGGADGVPFNAGYPRSAAPRSSVVAGLVQNRHAVVAWSPDRRSARISLNGFDWAEGLTTYTDAEVEAAKLRMWASILQQAYYLYGIAVLGRRNLPDG